MARTTQRKKQTNKQKELCYSKDAIKQETTRNYYPIPELLQWLGPYFQPLLLRTEATLNLKGGTLYFQLHLLAWMSRSFIHALSTLTQLKILLPPSQYNHRCVLAHLASSEYLSLTQSLGTAPDHSLC